MKELSKEHSEGITIAVKSVSRRIPFIKGWELRNDWGNYKFSLFINIIINLEELSKYYNAKSTGHNNRIKKSGSLNMFVGTVDFEDRETWNKEWEFFYSEKKKIESKINSVYEIIPEEYVLFFDARNKRRIEIYDFILDE